MRKSNHHRYHKQSSHISSLIIMSVMLFAILVFAKPLSYKIAKGFVAEEPILDVSSQDEEEQMRGRRLVFDTTGEILHEVNQHCVNATLQIISSTR